MRSEAAFTPGYTPDAPGLTMTNSLSLKFFIFAPAKFGHLDTTDQYQQVMRCCPACGAALVLFHEKFGDLIRGGAVDLEDKAAPSGGVHRSSDISVKSELKDGSSQTAELHGGWYCAQCGVHIMPEQKATLSAPRARSNSSRLSSRSLEDLKDPSKFHHADTTSTTSSKGKKLIDENFDELESHFHQSFLTLMSHIREHFTMKEAQLKEYQVDLCQRERIIRANESHLDQRIGTLRQAEVILKDKTDRLTLYKDTMLSQVEARAAQLARYEKSLNTWRAQMANEFGVPTNTRYEPNAYNPKYRPSAGQRPRSRSDYGGTGGGYGNPTYVSHQQLKQWTSQKQLHENKPDDKERTGGAKYEQDSSIPRQSWTASQLLANPAIKTSQSHLPTESTASYGARANQYSIGNVTRTSQNVSHIPQGKPPIQGGRRTTDPTGRFGPLYHYKGSQEQLNRGRTNTDVSEALSVSTSRNGYDSGRERSYTKQSGDSGYTSLQSPASQNVTAALPSEHERNATEPPDGDVTTAGVTSRTVGGSQPSKLGRHSGSHLQLPGSYMSGSHSHLPGSFSGSHSHLPSAHTRERDSTIHREVPGSPTHMSNGFSAPATFRPYTVRHGSRLVTEI